MYTEQAWIYKRAALSPTKIALIDSGTDEQWSYQMLTEHISKWIHYFQQKNYQKGDRVVVISQNRIELFAIIFACGVTGLLYVPLNFRLSKVELTYILEDCQPVLIIHDEAHQVLCESFIHVERLLVTTKLESASFFYPPETNWSPSDGWIIIYTGGTTGKPKGVELSFDAVNWNAINTITSWGLSDTDCTLNYMPMFHTGGLNALCIPILMCGGTVVVGSRFHAEEALKALNTYKTTLSLFVPTMYQAMLDTTYIKTATFPTVKVFLSGGAPCPHTIYKQFEDKGILFKEGYGLTEAGPNNFFIDPQDARIKRGSVGKCMLFNEVKIVNENGKLCRTNEVGELYILGKHVFTKYWNNEEETNRSFVDGWLKTGDLAKVDEDGYYYIVGRKKEMIISGGENVYPQEVEQCLVLHPNVREAAVIGVTDEKWGECVTAFVSCLAVNDSFEKELLQSCKQVLGSYKVPKKIYILDELPRTDVGKIDKKRLQELAVKI
ncbi:class I adenylate-forming enzyme family protein [Psychrobacillus lasiicapitis]|uniref:Long-chain fatty acid--CoA ligase n=1 Tax=Psychrobacillus lasiicapitis TaxID=1636719 RepID=A0A544TGZ5_9BACI|nr:AMP-binding protein [Psychrobacillus lasiicapitis]TQR16706.1 long-chain fatty acid--CoA ligase [Psychrobacillus lasiicapitis]GGA27902.1 long-chain-fatty-acid--CoA ligase [Psychrobacillus lasiicapitis]